MRIQSIFDNDRVKFEQQSWFASAHTTNAVNENSIRSIRVGENSNHVQIVARWFLQPTRYTNLHHKRFVSSSLSKWFDFVQFCLWHFYRSLGLLSQLPWSTVADRFEKKRDEKITLFFLNKSYRFFWQYTSENSNVLIQFLPLILFQSFL